MPTAQNAFNAIYSSLQRSYTEFVKTYNGKTYFLWVDLMPYKFTGLGHRAPYYTSYAAASQRTQVAGYLPDLTPFFYQFLPVYFGTPGNVDKVIGGQIGDRKIDTSIPVVCTMIIPTGTPGQYRKVYINANDGFAENILHIYTEESFTAKVQPTIDLQNQVVANINTLQATYNNLQKAIGQMGNNAPKEFYTMQGQLEAWISIYKNDPDFLVKVIRKDYTGKETISGIGFVPIVIAIVIVIGLAFTVTKTVQIISKAHEREKARAGEIQRIKDAFDLRYRVLTDKSLTDAQRNQMLQQIDTNITHAQDSIEQIQKDSNGTGKSFWDRIETYALLGGGFLILNNITKK